MKWNKVSEKELPHGEEVIAFNEKCNLLKIVLCA